MNKILVGIGIMLIFCGVVLASASNAPVDRTPQYSTIAGSRTEWEIHGGPYEKGQKLVVSIGNPPETMPELTFYLEVWPEELYENKTVFAIDYVNVLGARTPRITLSSNAGGLEVSNSTQLMEIAGTVNYAGNYWVNMTTRTGWWDPAPRPELDLEVIGHDYPYRYLLPIGAGLIAVGASSSILGAAGVERRARLKKKE